MLAKLGLLGSREALVSDDLLSLPLHGPNLCRFWRGTRVVETSVTVVAGQVKSNLREQSQMFLWRLFFYCGKVDLLCRLSRGVPFPVQC